MDSPDSIKLSVVKTALNAMLKKGHFNICAIDQCAAILGATPKGSESYIMLNALHCVDWGEMPEAVRVRIPDMIHDCLLSGGYRLSVEDIFTPSLLPTLSSTSGPVEPQRRSLLSWR